MKNMKRLFAVILALMLVLSLLPAVHAEEASVDKEVTQVQDLAANVKQSNAAGAAVAVELPTQWNEKLGIKPTTEQQKVLNASGENSAKNGPSFYPSDSIADLMAYVRGQLKNRTATFDFTYRTSSYYDYEAFASGVIEMAFEHTGVSTEGDYLKWHWKSWNCGMRGYEGQYITYTYTFTYLTTASQETTTTTAVNNLLKQLNLSGKTDYQKVCAIYDWMCDNITYDYDGLDKGIDDSPTTWTAYKGIVKGTCVCQGYASLFYRLALESGLSARVITGDGGGPHAWNIVKLGSKYYNLDATWDAGYSSYDWFLLGSVNFTDHYRDAEYDTSDFHSEYPTSITDYDGTPVPTPTPTPSGLAGDMDGDGELTTDDAVYLLLHVLFGEEDYPLAV